MVEDVANGVVEANTQAVRIPFYFVRSCPVCSGLVSCGRPVRFRNNLDLGRLCLCHVALLSPNQSGITGDRLESK